MDDHDRLDLGAHEGAAGASDRSHDARRVITWGEFANAEPELAAFGAGRLGLPPAYLATVRHGGAPRVHPVTPIIAANALFLFMEPTSPKGGDLRKRGWYALHNGVPDVDGSGGEFFVTGKGFAVEEAAARAVAAQAASYEPAEQYVLFELKLSEARCNGYGDVTLPVHRRWLAARPGSRSFRRAVPSDAPHVAHLVDAAYRPYIERIGTIPGPMTDDYEEVIRNHHVAVAERDGTIEGVIVLSVTDEGFLIDNVAVHPSRRGTGLGRALLERAEAEALRAGFDSVYLYTHEKMTENLALYSRIGYVEYDRRPQEDFSLVFMRKRLA